MSLILAIETATKMCSVALSENGILLNCIEEGGAYSHAEKLTSFIEKVLSNAGKSIDDLDAVAVSKGPGSYTGLRIGVATAKGLCYGANLPLVAVDTLKAMAFGMAKEVEYKDTLLCPMIDARRMEVFTALFTIGLEEVEAVQAKIIDPSSFDSYLEKSKIVFFGDGALKCKEQLGGSENADFSFAGEPTAKNIGYLAHSKLKNKEIEDIAYFEPYYLKDFVATTPKKKLL